jgi:cytidylate kinase
MDKSTQKKLRVIVLSSEIVKHTTKDVPDLEIYLCAHEWVQLNDRLFENENNPEKLKKLYN